MRILLVVAVLVLSGCTQARQFGAGFRDRGLEMAGEIAADELAGVVDAKLGDNFKEVKDLLSTIPGQIPHPPGSGEQGLMYTLGGLLAYIVGSFGKGAIRKVSKKNQA